MTSLPARDIRINIHAHMFGPKKLEQLKIKTGIPFNKAWRNGINGEGRVIDGKDCIHYRLIFGSNGTVSAHQIRYSDPHWWTCPVNVHLRTKGFYTGVGEWKRDTATYTPPIYPNY